MADIIDIRDRLRRGPPKLAAELFFRIRLCGPGLRWIGLVGGIVAGGLESEGFLTAFEDLEVAPGSPPVIDLCAGRPALSAAAGGLPPGLVVLGAPLPRRALQGCGDRTVFLQGESPARDFLEPAFSGLVVPLPQAGAEPQPFEMAVACAGGAARLLGVVGWMALEQALRAEMSLAEEIAVEGPLAMALEAYHRLAPWAAVVPGEACC